jgi:hypothetical protein
MMWSTKFVLLHIPRTGGTLLTGTFGHPPWVCKDVLRHKHVPAKLARSRVVGPEVYDRAHVFCIRHFNRSPLA